MEEKKILDVLMKDDTWKQDEDSSDTENGKGKGKKPEGLNNKFEIDGGPEEEYLSDIERTILRVIILGATSFNEIIRLTGYPRLIVNSGVERLLSKGFIDRGLNPTEKSKNVQFKKPLNFKGYSEGYKLNLFDATIFIVAVIFLLSVMYYMGLINI